MCAITQGRQCLDDCGTVMCLGKVVQMTVISSQWSCFWSWQADGVMALHRRIVHNLVSRKRKGKHKEFTLTSKKATKCWYENPMSSTPHISRIECIEREGAPTSTVLHPSPDAKMGPIVLPQPISLLTQNSWHGMPLLLPTSLHSPQHLKHNGMLAQSCLC